MRGPSEILFVQAHEHADHLPGVLEAVRSRGLTASRQDEAYTQPRVFPGTKVVVVTDLASARCLRALRQAGEVGARTALLLDGLTDWRNTFRNPRSPESFLRPAPVDVVLCSGQSDARVLRSLGNRAEATGLPRIDAAFPEPLEESSSLRVLVATANQPAFTVGERERLVVALREVRESAERWRVPLAWRLTDGLDEELGVASEGGPLREALSGVTAVLTTPSTLMVEAMRAGRAVGVLRALGGAMWHAAAWVWEPCGCEDDGGASGGGAGPGGCPAGGLSRWVDTPERLLRQLQRPTPEQMDRQAECLRWLDASSGGARAAELVAEAVVSLASEPARRVEGSGVRGRSSVMRLPEPVPRSAGLRRVVSVVSLEGSSVGGVLVNSRRLGAELESRPELGYDLRTLLLVWDAEGEHTARLIDDPRVSWCRVDRDEPTYRSMEQVRAAVERLAPDVVVPNYTDTAHMIGAQLRFAGVRCVGIGYTDDEEYRGWLGSSEWDGAAAGSESILRWLREMAGDRPCELVYCGVPVGAAPRAVPGGGPLELAYVGRMAQKQKRVLDLVALVEALSELRVPARLHLVGDGPELAELRRRMQISGHPGVEVVFHGARDEGWVSGFWGSVDACVLVSDAEGTSIVMLEAMARGVVPAVTRMSSGAGALVEDGVSGVTAPIGDMAHLAGRLAWLAADRGRVASLGAEAHRRVGETHSVGRMAERYAGLFDAVMARPLVTRPSTAGFRLVPPVERLPAPAAREGGLRRAISVVSFEESPVGGVTVWSQRLARAMAERRDLGYDLRTLLVAWDAASAHRGRELLDDRTSLCVLDRTGPMHGVLSHLRAAVERFEPDLVLPNYTDASHMVGAQLRHRGVRCVGIAHTDDESYRELLLESEWDGAVAVSGSIASWLGPLGGERPVETIVYGVPISDRPRAVPADGPLEIACIGRVVQAQKRVMDLVPVVEALSSMHVAARLHVVGDGPDLPRLRHALRHSGHPGVVAIFHGARDESWVRGFLAGVDVSLLVSESEGTSISMLEAMGAGVVPAVTRVLSGADEWVEDGVSGVSAPVGDPWAMAARLAWLAEDRSRLARLGAEAHRRVRLTQSVDRMAERYASLFDRVMACPIVIAPSAAGVTPLEPLRWVAGEDADAEDERRWAESWLREAGFARVGSAPGDGDVLFLPAGAADVSEREAGVPVVRSVLRSCRDALVLHVRALMDEGCRRIAIYGLGRHTQARVGVFELEDVPLVGIIDDSPPPSGEAFGLPVVRLGDAARVLGVDGILISSDAWESAMYERTLPQRAAGVRVRRIYAEEPAQAAVA
jgi:glycosyltransferase involved in cell wall biosynthesis